LGKILVEDELHESEGTKLIAAAAQQEHVAAQYALGMMKMTGEHTEVDYEGGRLWLLRAAEKNHPDAVYAVGWLHAEGLGVPADVGKARRWWQRAERLGSLDAKDALADS
jgi:TPR repeat protein